MSPLLTRLNADNMIAMLLNKSIYLIVASLFLAYLANAQPKVGKETIVLDFPTEYRWKSKKIPKDTKAIRGTAYTIRGNRAENPAVETVTVTTIDRRYFPMKAEGAPEEKWEYERANCPEATLDIVDKKTVEGRTAILYAIQSDTDDECGATILLTYLVEGPTAFHTVELHLSKARLTPTVYQSWCDALLQSSIK